MKNKEQTKDIKTKPNEDSIRLEVKAISFEWIFNEKEGAKFLQTLARSDTIDLFSLQIIRNIISFLWPYFRNKIIIYVFIPYLLYFSLFLIYSTYFHKRMIENNDAKWTNFGLANNLAVIVLLVFIAYFMLIESMQIVSQKLSYFKSFWNLIDLTSLLFNLIILIMDLAGMYDRDLTTLMSIAVLIVWLKLFYFGRIFLATAAMIRMVIEIIYDMKYFLLILLLAIAGFGNCYYILASNNTSEGFFTGSTYWRAFIYSYRQSLGDFDTSAYTGANKHLLFTIWFLDTLVIAIIMLNLLIAIMGDTFDRVQDLAENNKFKELASIMVENEILINRARVFYDAKYIIVIQEEKADEGVIGWEGRLQYVKKIMEKTVSNQNKMLKQLRKEIIYIVDEEVEK